MLRMVMRRPVFCLVLIALFALPGQAGLAAPAARPVVGWADIAAQVIPATVNIITVKIVGQHKKDRNDPEDKEGTEGQRKRYGGSGFIVEPSGIIVTNKHLIAGALWIVVRLHDGTEMPARVVAASPVVDLALLKVDAGHALPALKLAPGDAVRVGDPVLAIGNPLGFGTSLSAGIVSALRRDLMNTPFDDYVQTDAAINHGNSGGPLIDTAGEVIGVNSILITNEPNEGSNGLGFAISSSVVAAALRHLLHPEQRPIGWIGVRLQGMTPNSTTALGLPQAGGFIVTAVDRDSPARSAGMQPGDVILRYEGGTPANARALMREIATTSIGREVTLSVWQRGAVRQVAVTVRIWPGISEPLADVLANPAELLPRPPPDLGLLLAPISPAARKAYSLHDDKGVVVVAVDQMSEAFSRGLRAGSVIVRVQDHAVETPAAAYRLIHEAIGHDPLVALLVRWSDGERWIALHTGYRPEAEVRAGSRRPLTADGDAATGPLAR